MIVEPATFVIGEEKHRVIPVAARHQRVDDSFYIRSALLDADSRPWMFIQSRSRIPIDKRHLRQCPVLRIGEVLRHGYDLRTGEFRKNWKRLQRAAIGVIRDIVLPANALLL